MNPDTYHGREDESGEPDPAHWPPGKPGRPYGVYPAPPGLVRAPGQPPDPGTGEPAANPAATPPAFAASAASTGQSPAAAPPPAFAASAATAGQCPPSSPPASAAVADSPSSATIAAPEGRGPASPTPSPKPEGPLLRRQERFCQFFAVTGNATTAAWQAGYSFPTSRNQGYRLLRRPEVQARVAELQRDLARATKFDGEVMLGKLESVYRQAIEAKYFNAAARVVEIQARVAGQLRNMTKLPPARPAPENDGK